MVGRLPGHSEGIDPGGLGHLHHVVLALLYGYITGAGTSLTHPLALLRPGIFSLFRYSHTLPGNVGRDREVSLGGGKFRPRNEKPQFGTNIEGEVAVEVGRDGRVEDGKGVDKLSNGRGDPRGRGDY